MSDRVVVMQAGRIEQIGTPMEIYEEPVNLYVARFVGDINVLNGIIREQTGPSTYRALVEGASSAAQEQPAARPGAADPYPAPARGFPPRTGAGHGRIARICSAKFQQARLRGHGAADLLPRRHLRCGGQPGQRQPVFRSPNFSTKTAKISISNRAIRWRSAGMRAGRWSCPMKNNALSRVLIGATCAWIVRLGADALPDPARRPVCWSAAQTPWSSRG